MHPETVLESNDIETLAPARVGDHNGIMEEHSPKLGPVKKIGRQKYLTNLIQTKRALRRFLNEKTRRHTKRSPKLFPKLMNTALTSGRVCDIRILSTEHPPSEYVPSYEADKNLSMRILCSPAPHIPGYLPIRTCMGGGRDRPTTPSTSRPGRSGSMEPRPTEAAAACSVVLAIVSR